MVIDFFLFYLENEQMDGNFSSLFYESFLHIIVHFFRLEGYPQAEKELQELFGKYHVSQVR